MFKFIEIKGDDTHENCIKSADWRLWENPLFQKRFRQ